MCPGRRCRMSRRVPGLKVQALQCCPTRASSERPHCVMSQTCAAAEPPRATGGRAAPRARCRLPPLPARLAAAHPPCSRAARRHAAAACSPSSRSGPRCPSHRARGRGRR
eukprot:4363864-Prymnesium_polylepis.2